MLFPVNGSHFDMRLGGLVMAGAAATVVVFWGPRTLARFKIVSRWWLVRMAVGLGVLVLAILGALAFVIPVFRFPHPSGPHAIGTLTYHWVDASRADIFAADANAHRELMAQVWYRADAAPSPTRAPYMQEADAVTGALARIHDTPRFLFSQFKYVTTNAVASVRVADGQPGYPVLIFLEGAAGFRVLTGRLDLQRVGTFGVSLGGIVPGVVCLHETHVRACLLMDAPMTTAAVASGLATPGRWITREVASMRLERQLSGGWSEADIDAHQTSMRAVYESLPGAGYFLRVPGTFHLDFTDTPNWTPLASWLNLTGPIDGQRAHNIVNAYSLAFFDRHLAGRPAKLLDGPTERYPEVLFESRAP
ncbi:MAG: hypothetical protein LH632_10850 [Rhodoferax sp.]|nr:hypothetical protein [Rhodoferax sp.]